MVVTSPVIQLFKDICGSTSRWSLGLSLGLALAQDLHSADSTPFGGERNIIAYSNPFSNIVTPAPHRVDFGQEEENLLALVVRNKTVAFVREVVRNFPFRIFQLHVLESFDKLGVFHLLHSLSKLPRSTHPP